MVIALRVGQFWSEIKLVITNRTPATRSCDFVITRLISDQIALHSVELPLLIDRHIDIPTIYLQLKTLHRSSTNIDVNMTNTNNVDVPIALMSTSTIQHSNHSNDNTPNNKVQSTITTHPSTTNNIRSTSNQPIRRSQQRET